MATDDPRCLYCIEENGFKLLTLVRYTLYCGRWAYGATGGFQFRLRLFTVYQDEHGSSGSKASTLRTVVTPVTLRFPVCLP